MPSKDKSLTEKLNFIINNPDNILVQCAEKSKLLSKTADTAGNKYIDTSKYININEIEKLKDMLSGIDNKYKQSKLNIDKYINKTKALKIFSVAANIGISCLFLGYLIPKMIYKYRKLKTGTTKFHVEEDIKNGKTKK